MKELLSSLDWNEVIITIWTVVLLPILTYIGNEVKEIESNMDDCDIKVESEGY